MAISLKILLCIFILSCQSNELLPATCGQSCYSGPIDTRYIGICTDGITECNNNDQECKQEILPSEETCDGLDNNCNGFTDEAIKGSKCPNQLGACRNSRHQCSG